MQIPKSQVRSSLRSLRSLRSQSKANAVRQNQLTTFAVPCKILQSRCGECQIIQCRRVQGGKWCGFGVMVQGGGCAGWWLVGCGAGWWGLGFWVLGFCAGWWVVVKFIIKLGLARGLPRAGFGCGFDFAFMKKFLVVRSTQLTEPP